MNSNMSLDELAQKTLEITEKLQQTSSSEIERMFFNQEEESSSTYLDKRNDKIFDEVPGGPGLIYKVSKESHAFSITGLAFRDLKESFAQISRGDDELIEFYKLEIVEDLSSLIFYPTPSFRVALDLESHFCSLENSFLYDPESFIYFRGGPKEIIFLKGVHYKLQNELKRHFDIWAPQNMETDTFNMLKDHFRDLKISGILNQFSFDDEIIQINGEENRSEIYQDLITIFKEGVMNEEASILEGPQRLTLWENFQYFAQIKNFWSFNLKEGFI